MGFRNLSCIAETCMMMVSLFDTNGTLTLFCEEFEKLWVYLKMCRKVFDANRSKNKTSICCKQFAKIVKELKYKIKPDTVDLLFTHFCDTDDMKLDAFIKSIFMLKQLVTNFQNQNPSNQKRLKMTYETYSVVFLRIYYF